RATVPAAEMGAEAYAVATHRVGQAPGFVQVNEYLQLLDAVWPLYESRPPHLHAKKSWRQSKANWLASAGRSDEALAMWKQLAADYPREADVQRTYTDQLINRGDYSAAYAWLDKILSASHWQPSEEADLREAYLRYLQNQGRHADILTFLEAWLPRNPDRTTPYQMYLTALVWTDKEDKANETVAKWLKDGLVKGEMPPAIGPRLHAAIYQALGQGYNLNTNRIEERWLAPLADV